MIWNDISVADPIWHYPLLSCAASCSNHNPVVDDCSAVALSWTPPQLASSIKDNAPSGASLDFSVGSIYNSTHTACCLLLKTQVPRAGSRYRPLDVCRASALTVPSTCTRHSHVPEVTYPPHLQQLHRRHHHLRDSRHSTIPPSQSKTLSCRFDWYERTRPTRNTTFSPNSPSFLKMTIPHPLLRRKRRALTGGG